MISVTWDGVDQLKAVLAARMGSVHGDVAGAVRATAEGIRAQVAVTAPIDTGAYRASWIVDTLDGAGEAAARVGTDLPYARRLEFGFVGADSLGRVYNAGPRPHLGPAVEAARPVLEAEVRRAVFGA